MIGKKHRIRTYTAEKINEALNKEGLLPVETFESNTDEVQKPESDSNEDAACTDCNSE